MIPADREADRPTNSDYTPETEFLLRQPWNGIILATGFLSLVFLFLAMTSAPTAG